MDKNFIEAFANKFSKIKFNTQSISATKFSSVNFEQLAEWSVKGA
jgi:hypothetical protein